MPPWFSSPDTRGGGHATSMYEKMREEGSTSTALTGTRDMMKSGLSRRNGTATVMDDVSSAHVACPETISYLNRGGSGRWRRPSGDRNARIGLNLSGM